MKTFGGPIKVDGVNHKHPSTEISDASPLGRELLTASDAATIRSAIDVEMGTKGDPGDPTQVADGAIPRAKVNGLQSSLDARATITSLSGTNLSYSAASGLSTRPQVPSGMSVRIYGATRAQANTGFSWMIDGDYFDGLTS